MTVRWDNITVQGKQARAYVGLPDHDRPRPGILIAMHGPGLDQSIQDVVHRLNRAGYASIAPDLFHRMPAETTDMMAKVGLLRDDDIIADMNAAAAFLKAQPVRVGPLGVMGFCMGGRVSYLMATANPELRAAAVFYGGNILKPWGPGQSAFERSASINCPILGLFGAKDTNPSPEDVATIDRELTRLGKWHEFHSYQDAGHAFYNFINPDRHNARAARAGWGELMAFFGHYLGGGSE